MHLHKSPVSIEALREHLERGRSAVTLTQYKSVGRLYTFSTSPHPQSSLLNCDFNNVKLVFCCRLKQHLFNNDEQVEQNFIHDNILQHSYKLSI